MLAESKTWTVGGGDNISSSSQPASGFQSAWLGVPGQVSMADIVKMGRPSRVSVAPNPPLYSANHQNVPVPPSAVPHQNFHLSQDHASKESELQSERVNISSDDFASNDDWPSIEQPQAASLSTILEAPANSEFYADLSQQLDEVQVDEDATDETLNANPMGHASVSGRNVQEGDSGAPTVFDNNLYEDMSSYQAHSHAYEHSKGD